MSDPVPTTNGSTAAVAETRSSRPDHIHELFEKLETRRAVVGVIGLGYVGLPLLEGFICAGFPTLGFDIDESKIQQLQGGRSYIESVPAERITEWVRERRFEPTADMSRLSEADVLLICVPTPLTAGRDPDMSYVRKTARFIATTLRPGQLVILHSITFPTTTRSVLLPVLNVSGLEVGREFFVAYSPQRDDPGNSACGSGGIPRLIAGIDETSRRLAQTLYEQTAADIVPVSSLEVAEACRILENTYRAVNIALVNELKMLFERMGIDVWEVIAAARTKPFGFQAFYPGPGVGGHCTPSDPFYLTWLARNHGLTTRFIELAGEVNANMPQYVVTRLSDFLNEVGKPIKGSRICVLGLAYKKDLDDPRESPSFALLELLHARGAELSYNDPHIPRLPKMRHHDLPAMSSCEPTPEFLASQDCLLIATDHSTYDYEFLLTHAPLVLDTRNATRDVTINRDRIRRA